MSYNEIPINQQLNFIDDLKRNEANNSNLKLSNLTDKNDVSDLFN